MDYSAESCGFRGVDFQRRLLFVLNSYRDILSIEGAWKFSLAGLIARFPMSIVGIAQILMISTLYGSYTLAGQVSATNIVSYAIFAPVLARLVDKHGQSKVMFPAVTISAVALMGVVVAAVMQAPPIFLYVLTAISGAFSGSLGSMVRSRWSEVVRTPAQLHTAFSMESTADEFVYMTGPIIATLLTTGVSPIAGLLLAIVLATTGGYWLLSQKATEPPTSDASDVSHKGSVMRKPVMISLAIIYIGAGAMFGSIDLSVVAFTEELGVKSLSGVLLGIFAAGSMLAGLLYGARTWRFPLWKLFVGGVIALALGATLIGFAKSIPGMAVIMFITGFTISPTMINVNAMVQRAVPPRRLTEGLTWMSTSMNVGVSLGSAVAGRFVDDAGVRGGFAVVIMSAWAMAVVTILTSPVLRATSQKRKPRLPLELRSRRLGLGSIWNRRPKKKISEDAAKPSLEDDLPGMRKHSVEDEEKDGNSPA